MQRRAPFATATAVSVLAALGQAQCPTQGNAGLTVHGIPTTGSTLQVSLSGTPFRSCFLAADTRPGPTTLPGIGTFCLGPRPVFLTGTAFHPLLVIPARGTWNMDLTVPQNPGLGGITFYLQGLIFDTAAPNGLAISDSVALTVTTPGPVARLLVDGFEGDWFGRGWRVLGGVWELGAPASGPGAALTGSNVAATVLAGNYVQSQTSRLMNINAIQLPTVTGSEELQLAFWEWFHIGNGDGGHVEVSTDGGQSWVRPPCSANTARLGQEWCRKSIDLTAYAGMSIHLSFLFSTDANWNAPGWYFDDLEILHGTPFVQFPHDFENGFGDWWHTSHGTWEIGTPTTGPGGAFGGNGCAGTVLGGSYHENQRTRLTSPTFTLPNNPTVWLDYWTWFNIGSGDNGTVEVSNDGGCTWNAVGTAHTGSSGGVWSPTTVDLSAYAGQSVKLGFTLTTDANWNSSGWFIDDVAVR